MVNFTRFSTPVMKSFYQIRKGDVIETSLGVYVMTEFPKVERIGMVNQWKMVEVFVFVLISWVK